ncbi:MAG: hypothetical protein HPY61_09390 [Methanotrichaceae archaeon]|nr:hypothetical protein [Methanotrichaceae archaeon]
MASPRPDPTRYTYVYHPSREHKERWQKKAAKAHTSLSKFIIGTVDSVIDENEEFKPRREMVREMEVLKAEIKALRDDLRQKSIVLERYEGELKKFRAQDFIGAEYAGVRRYNKEIVELLKSRGQVDSYRMLEALGIDPRESDLVKAVSHQLEELEAYGMVEATAKGWRWIS